MNMRRLLDALPTATAGSVHFIQVQKQKGPSIVRSTVPSAERIT